MQKEKLMLLTLCIGLTLMFISWYQSYPLSDDSTSDYPFDHLSPLYWLALPMLLGTFYVMASESKSNTLRWIAVLGLVTSMFSLQYFYYLLPGSDSHYVRGLTEYFISTGNLDPSSPFHYYFQWPSFFMLCTIATNLLGLQLRIFEFILYAVIGFLCATSLYCYFSKMHKNGSYLAVSAFFIISIYQLNYQFAPFSLGLGLLFLLFMIESRGFTNRGSMIPILVIFVSMTLIHPFVSVFFVFYALVKYAFGKERKYMTLFMLTLTIYLIAAVFFTTYFQTAVGHLITRSQEYSSFVESLTTEPAVPLDAVAQMLSSSILIAVTAVTALGFIILFISRKLRRTDYAVFFSGILYMIAGGFSSILGLRAAFQALVPVSIGATYFLTTKFRKYYKSLFLVLIVLFTFVQIHKSYSLKWFQTRDDYRTANFFTEFYSLSSSDERILSYAVVDFYIQPKINQIAIFENAFRSPPLDLKNYDCIIYTPGLERTLMTWNYTTKTQIENITGNFNIVFSSGSSFIAVNRNASIYEP